MSSTGLPRRRPALQRRAGGQRVRVFMPSGRARYTPAFSIGLPGAALVACSGPSEEQPHAGPLRSPLIEAPPAGVAALLEALGRVYCSGSLVSARVVLTAAHCVLDDGVVRPPFAVYFGTDARSGGRYVRVHSALVHPSYEPRARGADLALLRLAEDVELPVLTLHWGAPAVQQDVAFSGFGESDEGSVGYRHDQTSSIVAVGETTFSYSPASCDGDSGGPVLAGSGAGWSVLGVASTARLCSVAEATPVVLHRAWLEHGLTQLDPAACREDGACDRSCPYGDPDCPCTNDDVCEECQGQDADCASACGSDGECSDGCLLPDPDCAAGLPDAECSRASECASGLCEGGRCLQRCGAELSARCPPWLDCVALDATTSVCQVPPKAGCALTVLEPALNGVVALSLMALAAIARRRRR